MLLHAYRGRAAHNAAAVDTAQHNGANGVTRHARLRLQLMRVMKEHGACDAQVPPPPYTVLTSGCMTGCKLGQQQCSGLVKW